MLKYLRVKNFLSFKEDTIISFESSNYWWKTENVFNIKSTNKKTTFEKSMIIYWANASWKTNILKVISFIKFIALSTDWEKLSFLLSPFLLDLESQKTPSFFEICFFVDNKEYIFNFEVYGDKIISENLIEIKNNENIYLYKRVLQKVDYNKNFEKESKKWLEKVKENVSFLAVLSQWNWILNKKPIDYFFKKINILLDNDIWPSITIWLFDLLKSEENKDIVIEFLKCADINIDDLRITKKSIPEDFLKIFNEDFKEKQKKQWLVTIEFWHKINNSDEIKFFPLENESTWTQKLFYILWPIIDSIINEKILFVDEIEANLHTHILKNLFKLIHSKIDKKYQFIFTTHNIELMNLSMFKKEQIWIVKKSKENISSFYTLYDFEEINLRSENDIKKLYNLWVLWWTPIVSDFSVLLNDLTRLWEKKSND